MIFEWSREREKAGVRWTRQNATVREYKYLENLHENTHAIRHWCLRRMPIDTWPRRARQADEHPLSSFSMLIHSLLNVPEFVTLIPVQPSCPWKTLFPCGLETNSPASGLATPSRRGRARDQLLLQGQRSPPRVQQGLRATVARCSGDPLASLALERTDVRATRHVSSAALFRASSLPLLLLISAAVCRMSC